MKHERKRFLGIRKHAEHSAIWGDTQVSRITCYVVDEGNVTLIVAKKINQKNLHIVSDTKITNTQGITRRSILEGALKSVIVSPSRCICFAGNRNKGLDAIHDICKCNLDKGDINELLQYLVDININSLGYTDFIVCELSNDSKIFTIKNSGCFEANSSWIGDKFVFEHFQESFHQTYHFINNENIPEKMFHSFLRIVHSDLYLKNKTVGDHIVVTKTTPDGFKYMDYSIAFLVPIPKGETSAKITRANGGYSESMYVPQEVGLGAIGIHFFPGNIGLLYYPKLSAKVIVKSPINPLEFSEYLKDVTGVKFTGVQNNDITVSTAIPG